MQDYGDHEPLLSPRADACSMPATMCDTIVTAGADGRSFFAKNSDREPGEPQLIQYSSDASRDFRDQPWLERREKYVEHSYRTLALIFNGFANPWRVLISRPSWMWGAEMGINEHGLAIGNEAVFSRQPVPVDGILGMDTLRLALHNARSAREGVDFITRLIEQHPQGGDGGYTGVLKYHNSYLLKDPREAFVLETSGMHWASRKVEKASISNAYSLEEERDSTDSKSAGAPSFKGRYEDRLYTFFSQGNRRQRFTFGSIMRAPVDFASLAALLRAHAGRDTAGMPVRGMGSVCMHTGMLIKSETTASMIVDYIGGKAVAWLSGSPHPCVSLFTPYALPSMGEPARLDEPAEAFAHARARAARSTRMAARYPHFVKTIRPLRDECEQEFARRVYEGIGAKSDEQLQRDCRACQDLETEYFRRADAALELA
jgi:secernin